METSRPKRKAAQVATAALAETYTSPKKPSPSSARKGRRTKKTVEEPQTTVLSQETLQLNETKDERVQEPAVKETQPAVSSNGKEKSVKESQTPDQLEKEEPPQYEDIQEDNKAETVVLTVCCQDVNGPGDLGTVPSSTLTIQGMPAPQLLQSGSPKILQSGGCQEATTSEAITVNNIVGDQPQSDGKLPEGINVG